MNSAKAAGEDDSTSAIVVSFDSKWLDALVRGKVQVVFRKRGPKHVNPSLIYAYVNSPVSALVAKLPVTRYEWTSSLSPQLCKKALLTVHEASQYAGSAELAVFHVGTPEVADPHVPLGVLSAHLGFMPPQSFFIVSIRGQRALNDLAGFQKGRVTLERKSL